MLLEKQNGGRPRPGDPENNRLHCYRPMFKQVLQKRAVFCCRKCRRRNLRARAVFFGVCAGAPGLAGILSVSGAFCGSGDSRRPRLVVSSGCDAAACPTPLISSRDVRWLAARSGTG